MKTLFEEDGVTVHGRAVPESGRIVIAEASDKTILLWDPILAGDWTLLGGSDYDSGFKVNLDDLDEIRKPKEVGNGLRYIVLKLKDGAIMPSLHFTPGGIDRMESYLSSAFVLKPHGAGIIKLEKINRPNSNLRLWEDDPVKDEPGKAFLDQTFSFFSKITKTIQENLVEDKQTLNQAARDISNRFYELGRERHVIIRETPVNDELFISLINSNKMQDLKRHIFKGGLTSDVRPKAWLALLDLNFDSKEIEDQLLSKYNIYKNQWMHQCPEQASLCTLLNERKSLISKDVIRTDPSRLDENSIERLRIILNTYAVYDQDIGYVQGMSDIAVVALDLYEDDNKAFWAFTKIMKKIRGNFEKSQKSIKLQFQALRVLLAFTDGELLRFLDKRDSGHLFFTFPWLLIIFRRLVPNEDVPVIWDSWLTAPCANYHLLIAAAVLDLNRQKIMQEEYSYCEILQTVNRLNGELKTEEILARAESLYVQISNSMSSPPAVKQILDLD